MSRMYNYPMLFQSRTSTTPSSGPKTRLIAEILRISAEKGDKVLTSTEIGRVARQVSGNKHASFNDTLSTSNLSRLIERVSADGLEYKIEWERAKNAHTGSITLHAITPKGITYSEEHPYDPGTTYNTLVSLGIVTE